MRTNNNLEQLDQLVHKFFHFVHLKSTFSILHIYFYKTPISICLFYTFIQIKYSFLYPHSHRPTPTIHTGIHTIHQQKTKKTNPAKWIKTHTHNPHRYHTGINTTHRQKTKKTNPAKWIKTHTGIDTSP